MSPKIRKGYLYSKAKSEAKSFLCLFFIVFLACLLALFGRPKSLSYIYEPGLIAALSLLSIGDKRIAELIRSLTLLARFSFLLFIGPEKVSQDIQKNRSLYSSETGEEIEELIGDYLETLSQVDPETENGDLEIQTKTQLLLAVLKSILIRASVEASESERE